MKRILLGMFLACWGAMAQAATVTLIDKVFQVTVLERKFGSLAWIADSNGYRLFEEANDMTWAQLGRPNMVPEVGVDYDVRIRVTADASLDFWTFAVECTRGGQVFPFLCSSSSVLSGRFNGGTVTLSGGSSSTVFFMSISDFGGASSFDSDFIFEGFLPDGSAWGYNSGFKFRTVIKPAPVPLPASGWLLLACVSALAATKRRHAFRSSR